MKTKLLLIVLLFMSSSIAAQKNEITDIKSNLKKEHQKVNELFNKQKNVIAKYQMVIIESKEVMAKVDALRDKPNSTTYKNAVKKAEALSAERNQLSDSIEKNKHSIDSINQIIAAYEITLQELEQLQVESRKEQKAGKEVKRAQKIAKTDTSHSEKANIKQAKQESKYISNKTGELLEGSSNKFETPDKQDTSNKNGVSIQQNKITAQETTEDVELDFWSYLYLIGGGMLFVFFTYLRMKKTSRCPKCGRWWTWEETSRTSGGKTSDGMYVYHINERCSECGNRRTREVRSTAKNKYDVH